MAPAELVQALGVAGLDGRVIGVADGTYEQRRRVWNGLFDRRPAAIVHAASAADVQRTIAVAGEAGCLLAVRCGGHSLPGFSTCDDGLVLDLSPMRRVVIDPERRTAEVGGGALLGDLDRAAVPYGLVAPAGVVSHTGAGGLTLGGGMGWLSRRFGMTIDSLAGADVCLADGRLVHVSESEEPELYWRLRGGGGNFGVVTRFSFRIHELGPVLVGVWTYPASDLASVLERFASATESASRQLCTAFTATRGGIRVTAFWSGSDHGARDAIASFGELGRPTSSAFGGVTFLDLQTRSDDHFAWGRRYYAKGGFLDTITPRRSPASPRASPTHRRPTRRSTFSSSAAVSDVADDATAYTGRQAGFYWIVEPVWDDPAGDGRCLAWGRDTAAQLAAVSMAGNYVNEQSDFGGDAALNAYGGEKYQRLAALKARLDPDNLFRLNQNLAPSSPPSGG